MKQCDFKLGTSANLLKGFKREWKLTDCLNAPFFKVSEPMIEEQELEETDREIEYEWSYPFLSFHETPESLLADLFPYRVGEGTDAVLGAILTKDADRKEVLEHYSKQLGVELQDPDSGFVLVKLVKSAGAQSLPYDAEGYLHSYAGKISQKYQRNIAKGYLNSKRSEKLQKEECEEYIQWFEKSGTHYIEEIELGDVIFQVFSYSSKRFRQIEKSYSNKKNPTFGAGAIAFHYYTTNGIGSSYGYVKEYGNIISLSGSERLERDKKEALWYEPVWSKQNSIFAPFDEGKLDLDLLKEEYREIVPIQVVFREAASLFDESTQKYLELMWNTHLCCKYGDAVKCSFLNPFQEECSHFMEQMDGKFVSTIATPVMNLYKEFLDMDKMQMVARKTVKEFVVYSHLLTFSTVEDCKIPGDTVCIAAETVSSRSTEYVKKWILSDRAFEMFRLYCAEFYGALRILNESGTKEILIVNGLVFERQERNARYEVVLTGTVCRPIAKESLPVFKNSISYALLFSEQNVKQHGILRQPLLRNLAQKSLKWISDSIPGADSPDADLDFSRIRFMANVGANDLRQKDEGSFVPILPYRSYKEYAEDTQRLLRDILNQMQFYQEQIENRRQRELLSDVGKNLNENMIQTGKLIVEAAKAFADNQTDVTAFYEKHIQEIKAKNHEYCAMISSINKEIKNRNQDLNDSITEFRHLCGAYMQRQLVDCVLNIVSNCFMGFASIKLPYSEYKDFEAIGKFYQMLQKIFTIAGALDKALSDGTKDIATFILAEKAYSEADRFELKIPDDRDWDEFEANIEYMLELAPDDATISIAKAAVMHHLKLLLIKGRELTNLQIKIYEGNRKVLLWEEQQEISQKQKARFEELENKCNPKKIEELEADKVDLIGMTGELETMQRQMLGMLSETFYYMDAALRYETMQPPTYAEGMDFFQISSAMNRQLWNRIEAESKMRAYQKVITAPISIRIDGVLTEDLVGGNAFTFCIQPNQAEFLRYVNVRVKSVVAEIENVVSTESAHYLLQLDYMGDNFYDRNYERELVRYHTLSRQRIYEYEAGSGKALFSEHGESWSQGVNAITPFAKWSISLPKVKTNKGIKFSVDHTTVTLTFVLQARICDVEERLLQAGNQTLTMKALCNKMADIPNVLNGWDVVLNMDLKKINESFEMQYSELSESKEYSNQIEITTESKIGKNLYSVKEIQLQYGYPCISFLKNNDSYVALKMEILGGDIRYGIKRKKVLSGETEEWIVEWEEERSKIENAKLSAQVPVSFVKGKTSDDHDSLWEVKLCFSKGAFSLENMDLDPVEEVDVAKGIKSHFQTHDIEYIINQINLTNYGVSHALTPSEFLFKMLQPSESKQILQLFIQTNGRKALDASLAYLNDIPDPIPENKDISLIISNEILYRDLLPEAFNQTTTWNMTGVKPDKEGEQWSAKFQEGKLQVKGLDLSSMTWSNTPVFGGKRYEHIYTETENGVKIPMKNGKVSESKKGDDSDIGKICFSLNVENEEYKVYHIKKRLKREASKKEYSQKFSLHMNALMKFIISGQGREQTIGLGGESFINSTKVDVGATQNPGCEMPEFEEKLKNLVKETLPDLIVKKLNAISFTDLSVFALQNFIFPAKRYISFGSISAPRALLLAGTFKDEKNVKTVTKT